jgi:hypothetical protein
MSASETSIQLVLEQKARRAGPPFYFLENTIKALKLSWRFRELKSTLLCPNDFRYAIVKQTEG